MKKMKRKKLKKIINDILTTNTENVLDDIMNAIDLYETTKYNENKLNTYCRVLKIPENRQLHNLIIRALKETIKCHGPVTLELSGSVAKRLFKLLQAYTKGLNQ